mmetsp:Transcript_17174/g.49825  ORF Transcript_17174/g.49825 Transcript_17174/m.49825 type:complete len:249 (+) Transcript_17174:589-1335(+)
MWDTSTASAPLDAAPDSTCARMCATSSSKRGSGREPHMAPTHATDRLRTAARGLESSGSSCALMVGRSACTRAGKWVSTSCRISKQQMVTSMGPAAIPSSSRGVSPRTAVPAADWGTSASTVLRAMEEMSRSSSLPPLTIWKSRSTISSTCEVCTLRTRSGTHLTASPCTSPAASLRSLSTMRQSLRSTSKSILKLSFWSSPRRSEVAMYRKSLSRLDILSMIRLRLMLARPGREAEARAMSQARRRS